MSNSEISTDPIEKSGKASRGRVMLIVAVLLLVISTPGVLFLFDEWQRERLLKKYLSAAASTNLPRQSGAWDTTLILQPNEVLACAMGSYGRAEDLLDLNARQRASLPKSKLPSEDGSWYVLFFSERQVERIVLFRPDNTSTIVFAIESCGGGASQFSIAPNPLYQGGRELVLQFLRK